MSFNKGLTAFLASLYHTATYRPNGWPQNTTSQMKFSLPTCPAHPPLSAANAGPTLWARMQNRRWEPYSRPLPARSSTPTPPPPPLFVCHSTAWFGRQLKLQPNDLLPRISGLAGLRTRATRLQALWRFGLYDCWLGRQHYSVGHASSSTQGGRRQSRRRVKCAARV